MTATNAGFISKNNSPYAFVSRLAPKISESGYNPVIQRATERTGIEQHARPSSNSTQTWNIRNHVLYWTYAESVVCNGSDNIRLVDLMSHKGFH